jgi:hypothetical protein
MYAEECPFKVVRTNRSDEVLARASFGPASYFSEQLAPLALRFITPPACRTPMRRVHRTGFDVPWRP